MGIDFNKLNSARKVIEEKLNKSSGNFPTFLFWKPKAGDNLIRIMPPWTSEGEFAGVFWREVSQHWGVSEDQKGPILCPKRTPGIDEECPICDFIDELRGMKDDVAAQALAKDLRGKAAYFLNIVDLSDATYTAKDVAEAKQAKPDAEPGFEVGDLKVQVFAAGPTVFNQILANIAENGVDITSGETAKDVKIKKTGKGVQGTKYEVTVLFGKKSKLDLPHELKLPELDKVGFKMDTAKMLEILSKGKGGDYATALPSGAPKAQALPKATRATKSDGNADYGISEEASDEDDLGAKLTAALKGSK